MDSKYAILRRSLNEIISELPSPYYNDVEVGYTGPHDKDGHVSMFAESLEYSEEVPDGVIMYGVYIKDTDNVICQTGQSASMAKLVTSLLNNMDLLDSALSIIEKLDEHYDLTVETEGKSLP